MAPKRGLGKGLDSLIPKASVTSEKKEKNNAPSQNTSSQDGVTTVDISKLQRNKEQPRKNFDPDALEDLAENIKQHGIINPILVQDCGSFYEIIAGERRWRAAMKAGLKEVPVLIRHYTDQEKAEIALIDNIQREDLNPIEEALAYKKLLDEFKLKQDELAEKVSKSRTAITNSMRLLKLCEPVQKMIIEDKITTGHARAIISVEDPEEPERIAEQIFDEQLSVRDVEKLVKNLGKTKAKKPAKNVDKALQATYHEIEENLKQHLGTKVTIVPSGKSDGSGKLEIEFYSHDGLEKLMDVLNKAK